MVVKSVTTLQQDEQKPPVGVGVNEFHFSEQGFGIVSESGFIAFIFL